MKRRALPVLLAALSACAPAPAPEPLSDGRYLMGTVLEIWLHGLDPEDGRALLEELFAQATALEAVFSRHDPESDLSRLNRAGPGRHLVHPELARLLGESIEHAELTRGRFDITIGPLVALWWQAAERDHAPDAEELAAARARVGARRLRAGTDGPGPWAELGPGMAIDLGGVAKGYALDRLAERAHAAGARAALLSFGQSSLHALGAPPGEPGWRVLVRDAQGGFAGVATLRDQSLSVSGSLGQGLEIAGRLYGHVVDPTTGQPLTRRAVASVVAATGSRAEALSKALLLLPPDEGMALLDSLADADGLLLVAQAARYESSGWRSRVHFEPLAEADQPPR